MHADGSRRKVWRRLALAVLGVLVTTGSTSCSPSHEEPQRPKEPPSIRSLGPSHQEPSPPQEEQRSKAKDTQLDESSPSTTKPESEAARSTPKWTHQLAQTVEYYKDGPQQMRPPDGKLPAGTKVRVLRSAGSYTLVESESGVRGYVASDALKPLPR